MLGGIWVTAVLAIVFVLLAAKTFGWTFFNATNVNFVNWFYGYTTTDPTIPIWSYPPLIASFLIDSRIVQIAIVVSAIYAYSSDFRALTLDATLVIAVTFLGSSVAATILPWWKPQIFNNSPVARYKLLISGAGLVTTLFLGWTIWRWLVDPLYGIGVGNTNSIKFLGVLYGAAALLYVVARFYRRSQGVDLDAIHAEIPAD